MVGVCRLACKTVGFLLKISKKKLVKRGVRLFTRRRRASLNARRACEARGKIPTVRFPFNEFVQTRGFIASHADVLRGSSRVPAPRGEGMRDEPTKNVCVGG